MNHKEFNNMIKSTMGVKNDADLDFNLQVGAMAFLLSSLKLMLFSNIFVFISITAVVLLDCILGSICALRYGRFETRKALKVVYYLPVYYSIAAVVLLIEKAFPAAFWMSEVIIMPILFFQTISILKNASLLNIIPGSVLKKIIKDIDAYKNNISSPAATDTE